MSGNIQLLKAVQENDIVKAKQLLSKSHVGRSSFPRGALNLKPDVNFRSPPDGLSLIEMAIEAGNKDMALLLEENGAKVEPAYKEAFDAMNVNTLNVNTTGLEAATPAQVQAYKADVNITIQKMIAESGGKYILGDVKDGIANIKDAATNEDVLTSKKLPDGNYSYAMKDPIKNEAVLNALIDSVPTQRWDVKKCPSIEAARILIAKIGENNIVFDDSHPSIARIKEQLDKEFIILFASERGKYEVANGVKFSRG